MHRVLGLLILIAVIACDTPLFHKKEKLPRGVQIVHRYYPNKAIKEILRVKRNKRHGLCKFYRQDGSLRAEYNYKYNKFHGSCTDYYSNGNVKLKGEYVEGLLNGKLIAYYKNGKIMSETEYKNNNKHGTEKRYYSNGKLKSTGKYYLGYPGLGLKEYTSEGKLYTDYPAIEVYEIDRIAMENTLYLKISLSDKSDRADFYITELYMDKYLPDYTEEVYKDEGIATAEYKIYRGEMIMQEINIIAEYKTHLGNIKLLTRKYNLAAKH